MTTKTEKVFTNATAPENAPQPQETRTTREGLTTLEYLTGKGIVLIGAAAAELLAFTIRLYIADGDTPETAKVTAKENIIRNYSALIESFTETERDTWAEKAGQFMAEGMNRESADLHAADLVFTARATAGMQGIEESHQDTMPDALQGHHTRPMREGLAALEYMTGKGIAMIGAYDSGATIAKGEAWAAAFTASLETLTALRDGKDSRAKGIQIQRFYFIPQAAGLLCLDIDCKNGKDGIAEFYQYCETHGKPRALLPAILRGLPESFPCYTSTPSGGYHLYFKYTGGKVQKKLLAADTPAVELKQGAPGLTAPGSYKEGRPYVLHGNIEDAPQLPAFILETLATEKPKAAPAYIPAGKQKKEWGRPSWDKIREWTEQDGNYSGRNDKAFSYAVHARNHGWTESETVDALRGEPGIEGLPETEIKTAVKSAYSKGRMSA